MSSLPLNINEAFEQAIKAVCEKRAEEILPIDEDALVHSGRVRAIAPLYAAREQLEKELEPGVRAEAYEMLRRHLVMAMCPKPYA